MMRKLVIIVLAAATIVILMRPAHADDAVRQKVDSLFIIATSGELKYRDLTGPAEDSIAAMARKSIPILIEKLGTSEARERVGLENIFKKIGKTAVPYLNDALLTTDSLQLSRVALMLNFLPDESSIDNLLKITTKPFYWVRYEAIRTLGQIGNNKAIAAVRTALQDSNEVVRTAAVVAAGKIKDQFLVPNLMVALTDSYYGVRLSAIEALQKFDCQTLSSNVAYFEIYADTSATAYKALFAVFAGLKCDVDIEIFMRYFDNADPELRALALRAAYGSEPYYVRAYLEKAAIRTDNMYLKQTIEELMKPDETPAPAKP
jgi:HEAT repeat protein